MGLTIGEILSELQGNEIFLARQNLVAGLLFRRLRLSFFCSSVEAADDDRFFPNMSLATTE